MLSFLAGLDDIREYGHAEEKLIKSYGNDDDFERVKLNMYHAFKVSNFWIWFDAFAARFQV